jgi:hypothetical protein
MIAFLNSYVKSMFMARISEYHYLLEKIANDG